MVPFPVALTIFQTRETLHPEARMNRTVDDNIEKLQAFPRGFSFTDTDRAFTSRTLLSGTLLDRPRESCCFVPSHDVLDRRAGLVPTRTVRGERNPRTPRGRRLGSVQVESPAQ